MHPHRARVHVAYDTDVCRHIIFVGKVHKIPVGALNKAINYYRDSLHPELQTQEGEGTPNNGLYRKAPPNMNWSFFQASGIWKGSDFT